MATFFGTSAAQSFVGTVGAFDVVTYQAAPGGVTVDVTLGGSAGWAAGDTYAFINRFVLSNLAAEVDTFTGSAANEQVFGLSGQNIIDGAGGNDLLRGGNDGNVLTGGSGVDTVEGGAGNDVFLVAAGDLVAGDRIVGYGGLDSIVLTAGGTGTTFDLSAASYFFIETIGFSSGVTGTLIVADERDAAITFGTADAGQVVQVNFWSGGDDDVDAIYDDLMTYLGNGIDAVTWTETSGTGGALAEIDGISGFLKVTYTNDGPLARAYETISNYYDSNVALEFQEQFLDSGVYISTDYDATGGAGNEILVSRVMIDLSIDGLGANYQDAYFSYDVDGLLEYSSVMFDNDVETEKSYDAGVLVSSVSTDRSAGSLAVNYETETRLYHANGTLSELSRVYDAGERFETTLFSYDDTGAMVLRNLQFQNGTGNIQGSAVSQTIVAGDNDDAILGNGGADTFVFSLGTGSDTIYDFDVADDVLDLLSFGIDDLADTVGVLSYANGNAILDLGGGDSILLRGVAADSLTDANFADGLIVI